MGGIVSLCGSEGKGDDREVPVREYIALTGGETGEKFPFGNKMVERGVKEV
jgi:hypothetical protein